MKVLYSPIISTWFTTGIFHGGQIDANVTGRDRLNGFVYIRGQFARSEFRKLRLWYPIRGDQYFLRTCYTIRCLLLHAGVLQDWKSQRLRGK